MPGFRKFAVQPSQSQKCASLLLPRGRCSTIAVFASLGAQCAAPDSVGCCFEGWGGGLMTPVQGPLSSLRPLCRVLRLYFLTPVQGLHSHPCSGSGSSSSDPRTGSGCYLVDPYAGSAAGGRSWPLCRARLAASVHRPLVLPYYNCRYISDAFKNTCSLLLAKAITRYNVYIYIYIICIYICTYTVQ